MLTGVGTDVDGKPMVFCGLTRENLTRLEAGEPVLVPAQRLQHMGVEVPISIVIAFAEDLATMVGLVSGDLPAGGKSS